MGTRHKSGENRSSAPPASLLLIALASAFAIASQSPLVVISFLGVNRQSIEISSGPKQSSRAGIIKRAKVSSRSQDGNDNVTSTHHEDKWPLLNVLIDDENTTIIKDVQFLVDFAIAGHPKTGTSTLMRLLASHPEVVMHTQEIRSLRKGKPVEFVSRMYELPHGRQYKRGYKAVCIFIAIICSERWRFLSSPILA